MLCHITKQPLGQISYQAWVQECWIPHNFTDFASFKKKLAAFNHLYNVGTVLTNTLTTNGFEPADAIVDYIHTVCTKAPTGSAKSVSALFHDATEANRESHRGRFCIWYGRMCNDVEAKPSIIADCDKEYALINILYDFIFDTCVAKAGCAVSPIPIASMFESVKAHVASSN